MHLSAEPSLLSAWLQYYNIPSLVPRPLPRFQCYMQKSGRAWYLKARAWRRASCTLQPKMAAKQIYRSELNFCTSSSIPTRLWTKRIVLHSTISVWTIPLNHWKQEPSKSRRPLLHSRGLEVSLRPLYAWCHARDFRYQALPFFCVQHWKRGSGLACSTGWYQEYMDFLKVGK
jgi:hypothetical protein